MTTLPPGSKLCAGQWTGVTCTRRERCARHVELKDADKRAIVFAALCPGRDDYWPHFVKVDAK